MRLIAELIQHESRQVLRTPVLWFIWAFMYATLALLFYTLTTDYIEQARLAEAASGTIEGITREVIKPYWGWVLLFILLFSPLLVLTTLGMEFTSGAFQFWRLHHASMRPVIFSKWITLALFQTFFVLLLTLIPMSTALVTTPDWGLLASGLLINLLMMGFVLSLSFFLFLSSPPLFAFGLTYGCLFILCLLPWFISWTSLAPFAITFSPLNHAHALMNGRFYVHDILYFTISVFGLLSMMLYQAPITMKALRH